MLSRPIRIGSNLGTTQAASTEREPAPARLASPKSELWPISSIRHTRASGSLSAEHGTDLGLGLARD